MSEKKEKFPVYLLICLIIYMEPPLVTYYNKLQLFDQMFDYLKIIFLVFTILYCLRDISSTIILKVTTLFLSVWTVPLIVSLLEHTNFKTGIVSLITVSVPSVVFVINYCKNKDAAIRCTSFYLNLLVLANLFTQIFYPHGIKTVISMYGSVSGFWLLGSENSIVPFALFAMVLNLIRFEKDKKYYHLLKCALIVLSIYLSTSATAFVGTALLLLVYIVQKYPIFGNIVVKAFDINVLIIVAFVTTILFVLVGNIDIFANIIVNVLKKDMTLTTRIFVWRKVIPAIAEKPLFGYGFPYINEFRQKFGVSHQHDFYLHLLYQGGFCSLAGFLAVINTARKGIKLEKTMTNKVLTGGLFAFLIMFISEVYDETLYILPFYLMLMVPVSDYYLSNYGKEKKK